MTKLQPALLIAAVGGEAVPTESNSVIDSGGDNLCTANVPRIYFAALIEWSGIPADATAALCCASGWASG
jgi:hypothetical protein